MLYVVSIYIIQFGAGLSLLIGLGEIYSRKTDSFKKPLTFITLCLAGILLRLGLFLNGVYDYPFAYIFFFVCLTAVGPFVLALGYEMIDFALPPRRLPFLVHFIPAGLGLMGEVYFHLQPYQDKLEAMRVSRDALEFGLVDVSIVLGILHVCAYLVYLLYLLFRVYREYHPDLVTQAAAMLSIPLLGTVLLGVAHGVKSPALYHTGTLLLVITVILAYLYSRRYPVFFDTLQDEVRNKQYNRTRLTGIDLEAVQKSLRKLMEEEKLFLDSELRLGDLASRVQINTHQLSRILNESYGQTFHNYLNKYRVEEACALLLADRERTVTSIIYEVGFNSRSSFNTQFQRFTGMSPAAYRRKET